MISNRQKMAAVLIIAILIFAIIAYAFYRPSGSSSETAAQSMILKQDDLGPQWDGDATPWDDQIVMNLDSSESWGVWKSNESGFLMVVIDLLVFVNTSRCIEFYENEENSFYEHRDVINFTSIPIGDEAFYIEANKLNVSDIGYPTIAFIRGPVYCILSVQPNLDTGPLSWHGPVLTEIANNQLNKIDGYYSPPEV
jgi:hypothetical protein